jgi:hypothetical protein
MRTKYAPFKGASEAMGKRLISEVGSIFET